MNDKAKEIIKYALASIILAVIYIYSPDFDYTNALDYLLLIFSIAAVISWWKIIITLADEGFWLFLLGFAFWPYLIWYGFMRNREKALIPTISFSISLIISIFIKQLNH